MRYTVNLTPREGLKDKTIPFRPRNIDRENKEKIYSVIPIDGRGIIFYTTEELSHINSLLQNEKLDST